MAAPLVLRRVVWVVALLAATPRGFVHPHGPRAVRPHPRPPLGAARDGDDASPKKIFGVIPQKQVGPTVVAAVFGYFLVAEVLTVASTCWHFLPYELEAIDPKTGVPASLKLPFCVDPPPGPWSSSSSSASKAEGFSSKASS
mmetsp:Transcript_22128/g.87788  ORF Transcript_22128/g.87788 Transcript_22128/m.87788 type:complete len:142 (+) Transcript_22128:18-443(+)